MDLELLKLLENDSNIGDIGEQLNSDDAAWALTCSFLILTMQTGFAMLECGCVSQKNVSNIMIKNVVDVSVGGFSYWLLGHGFSFGAPSTAFCGYGNFLYAVNSKNTTTGTSFASYFFHLSFASTATTIVSGAVAERMKLSTYIIFSFMNTFIYCFPASWAWNDASTPLHRSTNSTSGWLYQLRFFDFAGVCVVHLVGGASALVAAAMLGPRIGRFETPEKFKMSSPVTSLTGMFMLWWAWLGFNCGSTFGVSGGLWTVTALVSVTTLNGSIGGGLTGLIITMSLNKGRVHIEDAINSVLGGLVAITGIAAVTTPIEALAIGSIGGMISISAAYLMNWIRIDDPVGAANVHFFTAIWGTLAVGLFANNNSHNMLRGLSGLFHGGGGYLLGVQALAALTIGAWSASVTFVILTILRMTLGIRMSKRDEILGADFVEHGIQSHHKLQAKVEEVLDAFHAEDLDLSGMAKLLEEAKMLSNYKEESRLHRVLNVERKPTNMVNDLLISDVGKLIKYVDDRDQIRQKRSAIYGSMIPISQRRRSTMPEMMLLSDLNGVPPGQPRLSAGSASVSNARSSFARLSVLSPLPQVPVENVMVEDRHHCYSFHGNQTHLRRHSSKKVNDSTGQRNSTQIETSLANGTITEEPSSPEPEFKANNDSYHERY